MRDDELIPKQAAELTGYSVGHIRWLARNNKIKSRRIGERVLLIDAQSLEQYVIKVKELGTLKHAPQ